MNHAGRHIRAELLPEAGLSRRSALALISAAGDIAVVVDGQGVVRDAVVSASAMEFGPQASRWIGKAWVETVVADSRAAAQAILDEVHAAGTSQNRQVCHNTETGNLSAFMYAAIEVDAASGQVVLIARESKVAAPVAQNLADPQQTLERDYWRMRNMETRYRLLHQLETGAVVEQEASPDPHGVHNLTQAVERLSSLVGRVALRDLVRDTTELVERHFIHAALELTDNNRSAAAGVLGLSRQSLYVKLRRQQQAPPDDQQEVG